MLAEQPFNFSIPNPESDDQFVPSFPIILGEIVENNEPKVVNQYLTSGWTIPAADHGKPGSKYHGVSGKEHTVPLNGRRLLYH